MTFVVVYLIRAREFIIVPDSWVQDLNKARLKNNGRNSNQDFLVYVSAKDGKVVLDSEPDFNAPLTSRYVSTINACFLCRVKKFFDDYESANVYCARQRRLTPPVYNEARLNEQPLPNTERPTAPNNNEESRNEQLPLANSNELIILETLNLGACTNKAMEEETNKTAANNGESLKKPVKSIQIFDPVENGEQTINSNHFEEVLFPEFDPNASIKVEDDPLDSVNNFDDEYVDEEVNAPPMNYEVISEDLVMFYENDGAFKPKSTNLRFKSNDVLSGGLLFREYDDQIRGYIVDVGVKKEIRIKADTLNKLLEWNTKANIGMFDVRFIRTLLITCIGKKNLKTRQFHENTATFIRDLFQIRCGDDKIRFATFDDMMEAYIQELKKRD